VTQQRMDGYLEKLLKEYNVLYILIEPQLYCNGIKDMPKQRQTTNGVTQEAYKTYNDTNREQVIGSMSKSLDRYSSITRSNEVQGSTTDISLRAPFDPSEYARQRPGDVIPTKFKDVIKACRRAYLFFGVVRNVIDLMTDFAIEDLKLPHPDKKVEAFFKVWMAKVDISEAASEYVRHFLIDGNVVVKRTTAIITKPVETQWMERVMADADQKLYVERQDLQNREIPWRYSFINTVALEWLGTEEEKANGERQLAFKPSARLLSKLKGGNDAIQKDLNNTSNVSLTNSMLDPKSGLVKLDMSKVYVAHNKKDSWEDWAPPFLYAVLGDLNFKTKLRQAEYAALDGIINVVRLWKLGDHKEKIFPAEGAIDKLLEILSNNPGGGAIDIIWDSMIDMEPFYPPIDKILGAEKYTQVNRDILIGLGVPDVLLGGQGANFSNSFIQLKTIIEKLKYVRKSLQKWLYEEVHIVCKAMDIPVAPKVRFGQMNLEDENTTRKLIVGLLDRGVISVEAVLEVYGQDFLMEIERMRSEKKTLKSADIEPKGPFDQQPAGTTPKGQPGQGRPPATKDTSTRDQRTPKPRRTGGSELTVFALDAIDSIDENIIPDLMKDMKVSNARQLTNDQKEEINISRMICLASINPKTDISKDALKVAISGNYDQELFTKMETSIREFSESRGQKPTLAQRKRLEAIAWSEFYSEIE
jgi:hypothetical protein